MHANSNVFFFFFGHELYSPAYMLYSLSVRLSRRRKPRGPSHRCRGRVFAAATHSGTSLPHVVTVGRPQTGDPGPQRQEGRSVNSAQQVPRAASHGRHVAVPPVTVIEVINVDGRTVVVVGAAAAWSLSTDIRDWSAAAGSLVRVWEAAAAGS